MKEEFHGAPSLHCTQSIYSPRGESMPILKKNIVSFLDSGRHFQEFSFDVFDMRNMT